MRNGNNLVYELQDHNKQLLNTVQELEKLLFQKEQSD